MFLNIISYHSVVFQFGSIGWVHRHLSVSNIYSFEGRLLIGDWGHGKCGKDASKVDPSPLLVRLIQYALQEI